MKKTLLILALGSVLLTSCDPLKAEGDFIDNNVTSETIIGRGTFAQYDGAKDENGEMVYTPSEDGNYIDFSFPELTAVTCYYVNKKGGEEDSFLWSQCGESVLYATAWQRTGADYLFLMYGS